MLSTLGLSQPSRRQCTLLMTRLNYGRIIATTYPTDNTIIHNYSSSKSFSTNLTSLPCPSQSALNLGPTIDANLISSIRQLPEVQSALTAPSTSDSISLLSRAAEVFESLYPGKPEHRSVLAILADKLNEKGDYQSASSTLRNMRSMLEDQRSPEGKSYILAQAKAEWNGGDFREAIRLSNEAIAATNDIDEKENDILQIECCKSASALSKFMLLLSDAHDAEEVDPNEVTEVLNLLADVARRLEDSFTTSKNVQIGLASAAAWSNLYVAEAAIRYVQCAEGEELCGCTFPEAEEAPKKALSLLKQTATSTHYTNISQHMTALLNCNTAWMTLFPNGQTDPKKNNNPIKEAHLTTASQLSQHALKTYDSLINDHSSSTSSSSPPLPYQLSQARALTLVASCYFKAGSAVTAEGLLQSAIGTYSKKDLISSPISKIDARDAFWSYAALLDQWENRSGDSEKMRKKGCLLEDDCVEGWRERPGIVTGLWFFSSGDF